MGFQNFECCQRDAYSATITAAEVPLEATQLLLVIETSSGELPTGRPVPFEDLAEGTRVSGANSPYGNQMQIRAVVILAFLVALPRQDDGRSLSDSLFGVRSL